MYMGPRDTSKDFENSNTLITLIKVQAHIRAYLDSKKVNTIWEDMEKHKFGDGDSKGNYENEVVTEKLEELGMFEMG